MSGIWQLACAILVFALLCLRCSPERVRAQDGSSAAQATTESSSASLNNRDIGKGFDGQHEQSPVEDHEIDRIRREMGYGRPPHFDIRSRSGFSSASPTIARAVLRERPRVKGRKLEPFCQPCDRVFIDQYSYYQHNAHKHPKTFSARTSRSGSSYQLSSAAGSCELCERTFDSAIALLQHKAACRNWSNGCSRCSIKSFRSAEEATAHYRRAHPARHLSPSPHAHVPSRRSSSTYSSNPTLRENVVTAEPDPTLPELQRTYGCESCNERFSTAEDRDEHLSSPFAHGDQSALAAAFPPLSASPVNSLSASVNASPIKEQPEHLPPLASVDQLKESVEVIEPESIPLPEDTQSLSETASIFGERPSDASSDSDLDQAVALDQPLPSFQFSSDNSDLPSAPSSVSAELVTPDGSDSETNPYRWGEIIEPAGPPGLEAFPELPSRPVPVLVPADDQPKSIESRWHTGEKPLFAIPDLTPKPEKHTFWEADVDPRPWSEQIEDEYADELPSEPINMPRVSGSNSIPLGTRRSSPSVILASPVRSNTPNKGRSRRPPPASLNHYQVNSDYNNYTQNIQVGEDPSGANQGGKYPLPKRPLSPEGGQTIYGEIEEQIPNFAYAGPGGADGFNAFPEAPLSLVDPMGPKPAPVKAQPSVWSVPAQPRVDPSPLTLPKVSGQSASMSSAKNNNIIPASPTGSRSTSSSGPGKGSRAGTVTPGQPGPRARWADRSKTPNQPVQPLSAAAAPFDLGGWTTSVPAVAPKRSRGGKAVAPETWAEREAREARERREAAERMKIQVAAAGEEDPYGGW